MSHLPPARRHASSHDTPAAAAIGLSLGRGRSLSPRSRYGHFLRSASSSRPPPFVCSEMVPLCVARCASAQMPSGFASSRYCSRVYVRSSTVLMDPIHASAAP
eukprot:5019722-Prymnesium_polylepis.1